MVDIFVKHIDTIAKIIPLQNSGHLRGTGGHGHNNSISRKSMPESIVREALTCGGLFFFVFAIGAIRLTPRVKNFWLLVCCTEAGHRLGAFYADIQP